MVITFWNAVSGAVSRNAVPERNFSRNSVPGYNKKPRLITAGATTKKLSYENKNFFTRRSPFRAKAGHSLYPPKLVWASADKPPGYYPDL